jgi:hypothetical protein
VAAVGKDGGEPVAGKGAVAGGSERWAGSYTVFDTFTVERGE